MAGHPSGWTEHGAEPFWNTTRSFTNASNATGAAEEPWGNQCLKLAVSDKVTGVDSGLEALLVPVALNVVSLIGAVVVLVCITRSKRAKDVFVPRLSNSDGVSPGKPWDWFRAAYYVDEEEHIPIDGRVVVNLCMLGLKFSVVGTVGACILMPIYRYAGTAGAGGSSQYSISNLGIEADQWVLGVIVFASYIYTFFFMWLMRAEWNKFSIMRQKHLAARVRGELGAEARQAALSLMVERVPKKHKSSRSVQQFFKKLFEDRIHSCRLHRDTLELYHLKALKASTEKVTGHCSCCQANVEKQLERVAQMETGLVRRLQNAAGTVQTLAVDGQLQVDELVGLFGRKSVDNPVSGTVSSAEVGNELTATSTAFLTLESVKDRTLSEQVVLFGTSLQESAEDWEILPAPEKRDVIWENVGTPLSQVRTRIRLGQLACITLVMFWTVPVSSIQAMSSEKNLQAVFPGEVKWLQEHALPVYRLIVGYLPVLALMALILLLPYALHFLALRLELRKTRTDIARSILSRNFMFQFFSIWLTVFSSSLADSFRAIVKSPECSYLILGKAIPKVSLYFVSFVIARIGISLPLLLLRPFALIDLLSRRKPDPAYCIFETEATNIAIVFVIGSMYCVVAPVIMPACVIYFALAFLIYKWLFVHVYEIEFDVAGELWYEIFAGMVGGMVFGMLSVLGLISSYTTAGAGNGTLLGRSWEFVSMFLLNVILIYFAVDIRKRFTERSGVLPYEEAVRIEREHGIDTSSFSDTYYVDPILTGELELKSGNESRQLETSSDEADTEEDGTSEEGGGDAGSDGV